MSTLRQNKMMMKGPLALLVVLCLGVAGAAQGAVEHHFANGIKATIHLPADYVAEAKAGGEAGETVITTAHGTVTLQKSGSTLYPFALEYVERALADMHSLNTKVEVTVYILSAIPVATGSSFARQDAIYLAPGTGEVDESTVAYITTHEMGHVLTWAFMDGQPARWDSYLEMRDLDLDFNGPHATHADRAREILAEDMRYLFGGRNANRSGSIENHDLMLPNLVGGLKTLLSGFFQTMTREVYAAASSAFPNPCNPLTTVAMEMPADFNGLGDEAQLRIFDIRGALVKIVRGGKLANNRMTIQWNGTTADGGAAASGHYLYVIQAEGLVAKGAVTLVR
ncbi:MAG: hypothetical protein ACI9UQ_000279 [Candidatus Krumholzibacteriia bacterium]|jgi:hypothetical protein